MINEKVSKNTMWLVVGGVAQSLLGFVVSLLTVRYLGPDNYGLIRYVTSIIAFVAPISTLGLEYVLVYEFSNNEGNEGSVLGVSVLVSLFASLVLYILVLILVAIINKGDITVFFVCCLYSTMLFTKSLYLIVYWYQYKLLSKYISIVSIVSFTITSVYKIYILAKSKNIYWFSLVNSIEFGITAMLLLFIYRIKFKGRLSLNTEIGKKVLSRSKYYILTALASASLVNIDQIMIKNALGNTVNGYYGAAINCCNLTYFVFAAIIDSFRPMIFKLKDKDKNLYESNISNLYSIVIFSGLIQAVFMSIFSKEIVRILYGNSYDMTANILRIISPIVVFSQLSNANSVWVLSEGKQKVFSKISIIGALINIVLNYVLLKYFGLDGVIFSTIFSYAFIGFISYTIVPDLRYNVTIILRSLSMKLFVSNVKNLLVNLKKRDLQ